MKTLLLLLLATLTFIQSEIALSSFPGRVQLTITNKTSTTVVKMSVGSKSNHYCIKQADRLYNIIVPPSATPRVITVNLEGSCEAENKTASFYLNLYFCDQALSHCTSQGQLHFTEEGSFKHIYGPPASSSGVSTQTDLQSSGDGPNASVTFTNI